MRKSFLTTIAGLAVFTSCVKTDISAPDNFSVSTDKTTYLSTDTVTFKLSGTPDIITFYSGEPGKTYELSTIKEKASDSTLLNFSTATTAASATTQPLSVNNVSILVSTNFSGNMDPASIKTATWTDISNRFNFATTTTTVASKTVRVDDLKVAGSPLYVAFKYVSDTTNTNYLPRRRVVTNFGLRNYFGKVMSSLAGGATGSTNPFISGGFVPTSILNSTSNWVFASTSLTFNATAVGALPDEDWAISRPFDLSLYPSDLGESIKNSGISAISSYSYRFTTPGTYLITFVAKNANSKETKESVKQITLTIQ